MVRAFARIAPPSMDELEEEVYGSGEHAALRFDTDLHWTTNQETIPGTPKPIALPQDVLPKDKTSRSVTTDERRSDEPKEEEPTSLPVTVPARSSWPMLAGGALLLAGLVAFASFIATTRSPAASTSAAATIKSVAASPPRVATESTSDRPVDAAASAAPGPKAPSSSVPVAGRAAIPPATGTGASTAKPISSVAPPPSSAAAVPAWERDKVTPPRAEPTAKSGVPRVF
jgi:hypothetical protein